MATVLFLNDTQVFPASGQNIKLTRENPYFTQSDSYTLDVVIPMDVVQNRQFFGNVNRMEKSKALAPMTCRLVVDNVPLLSGSARVTQVTEKEVKVQLLGGNSEINFLSEDSGIYIDEMSLGTAAMIGGYGTGANGRVYVGDGSQVVYAVDTGIRMVPKAVYDETLEFPHGAFHYNLTDILKKIVSELGYTIEAGVFDTEPWNQLFVATANYTYEVAHTLPHWTPKTLFSELGRFFNVTFVFDQAQKKLVVVRNPEFFAGGDYCALSPVEEYTVEMTEESNTQALAADNISFDMSSSEYHDYDVIPDNVRENASTLTFASKNAAVSAYNAADEDGKKKNIYACPTVKLTGWLHEYKNGDAVGERLEMTEIDMFAPLVRDSEGGSETSLKICPVAFRKWVEDESYTTDGGVSHVIINEFRMPSLECPAGSDKPLRQGLGWYEQEGTDATIQEYITGEAEIEKAEKEDRMQLMFISGTAPTQQSWSITWAQAASMLEFTDFQLKKNGNEARPLWSMSLNPSEATYYLGQLHQNGFTFNMKAKLCAKFLANKIPDPKNVFIIRNRRYGCEKIEAHIDDIGLSRLMTGYFYEMD